MAPQQMRSRTCRKRRWVSPPSTSSFRFAISTKFVRILHARNGVTTLFVNLPYVCPEPVLANIRIFSMNGIIAKNIVIAPASDLTQKTRLCF